MIPKSLLSLVLISASALSFADSIKNTNTAAVVPKARAVHALSMYGELFGLGGIMSINGELGITPQTRIRLGFGGALGTSVFGSAIWLPGSGKHRAELGLGVSTFRSDGFLTDEPSSVVRPSVSAGYRFQATGGFLARAGVTVFSIAEDGNALLPWPYLSAGYSF